MVEAMHSIATVKGETRFKLSPIIINEAISKYIVHRGVLVVSPRETDLKLGHREWLFVAKFCTGVARYVGEVSFWPALRTRQNYFIL